MFKLISRKCDYLNENFSTFNRVKKNWQFKGELKVSGSNLINKYVIEDEALEQNKNAANRP